MIYVIGFLGSDRMAAGRKKAEETGLPLIDLHAEVVKRDGRSIRYMVMSFGEHELHNKEFDTLTALNQEYENAVIVCGDDTVLDPQIAELIGQGEVIVAEEPLETMYERACADKGTHYAFLSDPDEARRKKKYMELYEKRKDAYESFK